MLPVYDGDQRVWVVFSGEEPIATHPQVETPLKELLRHYDMGKRTPSGTSRRRKRGGEAPAVGESTGAGRRRKRRDKTPAVSEPTGTGRPTAETDSPTTGDDASEGAATTPGA